MCLFDIVEVKLLLTKQQSIEYHKRVLPITTHRCIYDSLNPLQAQYSVSFLLCVRLETLNNAQGAVSCLKNCMAAKAAGSCTLAAR